MAKICFLLLVSCLLICNGSSKSLKKTNKALWERGQVVFLGDSITDAWDNDGIDTFNQFYAPLGTVNTGISGDQTSNIIQRINEGMIDNLNAYLATLLIGTNDLAWGGVSETDVVKNIGTILDMIREKNPNCKILLLAILPRGDSDSVQQSIHNVNAQLGSYADGESVFYLDMESAFTNEDGTIKQELFWADKLHLANTGYQAWAETMNPIFNEILNRPFAGKAVFFGDSITAGWNGNGKSIWDANYAALASSNFGISGHITNQTIARILDEGVLNGLNSKIAVLKIGTNDLSRNVPEASIAANIRTILDLILEREPHTRILLLGILPRNGVDIATRAENVNALIGQFDNGDNVRFLNMKEKFQLAIGQVIPELYTDGLHLTTAGYQVWADTMNDLFQQLIQFK